MSDVLATQSFSRGERADSGRFQRQTSKFRDWVTDDGSSSYPAAAGRYHLYVSLACPWAHRAVIVRELKGLQDAIGMSIVDPYRDERGWAFTGAPGTTVDQVNGWSYLSEGYLATEPDYDARITVPVLWDTQTGRIVNNESADIIVMLNGAFDEFAAHPELDLYPTELRPEIDELNEKIYENVNNGVYRSGFASSQEAYEEAVFPLFETLDELDERLGARRYLAGEQPTLADWRLFTTLLRFDPVYVGHFKCNLRRIVDYPNLSGYLRDLHQTPGVAATVDIDQIKRHYYTTHGGINPSAIVPAGPVLDLDAPHGREGLAG
ncbi:MAG: glutathionyl-hydroquinone reductase [Solirubrobacteraceae bacterium]|jgi:putative glutathione S-transferase|nr:glutathionyl-hydroquinone reductase [Solirubrobacteraceae bacterium]